MFNLTAGRPLIRFLAFQPTTALESSVDALLKSAGLKDEDILHTEESMLQMNQLSVEEIAQRRGELRKMRELMFRAEVKAKRIGKIKSKAYRRIKRKEKERVGEMIDGDDNEDTDIISDMNIAQDFLPINPVTPRPLAASDQSDDESDSNSEVGAQEIALTLKGKGKASGIKAFEQRDLVAAAFAGDNVVQVFFFPLAAFLQ